MSWQSVSVLEKECYLADHQTNKHGVVALARIFQLLALNAFLGGVKAMTRATQMV